MVNQTTGAQWLTELLEVGGPRHLFDGAGRNRRTRDDWSRTDISIQGRQSNYREPEGGEGRYPRRPKAITGLGRSSRSQERNLSLATAPLSTGPRAVGAESDLSPRQRRGKYTTHTQDYGARTLHVSKTPA